jgi:uncharacterized repeat protein (TIGR01451 family)
VDVALQGNQGLVVLKGKAGGLFENRATYPAGGYTSDLELADFDGDGSLDAALLLGVDRQVAIFTGSPQGAFTGPYRYTLPDVSTGLAAANFNSDGRPDIATVSPVTGMVSLWINDGAGRFDLSTQHFVGYGSPSLAAGDVNEDGYSDLVVTRDINDPSVETLLLSDGVGGFVSGPRLPAGGRNPVLALINGDSHLDLVIPLYPSAFLPGMFVVMLGDGSGAFSTPQVTTTFRAPLRVAAGDVDHDGIADLVSADAEGNCVEVLLGAGDGSFVALGSWGASDAPASLTLADIDGDTHLDVLSFSSADPDLAILRGQGDGRLHGTPVFHIGGFTRSIATGRFDADALDDLALPSGGGPIIYLGQADGQLGDPSLISGVGAEWVVAGDFNGDGVTDLATGASSGANNIAVMIGDGTGAFGVPVIGSVVGGTRPGVVGDLNGDGLDDLVVPLELSDSVAVLLAVGAGQLAGPDYYPMGDGPVSAGIADFDGDGVLDIVTANRYSNDIAVLRGLPGGGFGQVARYSVGLAPAAVAAGDLDGNGRPDIVVANESSGTVSILWNRGGVFRRRDQRVGQLPIALAIDDLDRDGHADLIVTSYTGPRRLQVFRGIGGGRLDKPLRLLTGRGPFALAAADFDGDGRLDLVTSAGNLRGDLWLLRNTTPMADLAVTVDDSQTSAVPGGAASYSVQVTNHGPDDVDAAHVRVRLPQGVTSASWTCTAPPGSSCTGDGIGGINEMVQVRAGATVTFVLGASLAQSVRWCLTTRASVSAPSWQDPEPSNNSASDSDGTTPSLSIHGTRSREGAGEPRQLRFLVQLSSRTCSPVEVAYSTSGGTATAGQDYVAVAGTFTFAPGIRRLWFEVPVLGDTTLEDDETVVANLASPSDATIATPEGIGTIIDDDPGP